MKVILLGILFQCLNTLSGSSFDTITKIFGNKAFEWHHYYSIGNIASLLLFLFYLNFNGGIKNNIILKTKSNYIIPFLRGLIFIPIPIIVFNSIKHVPLNVFTSVLMTTPFFILLFSKLIQNEKISINNLVILIIGFGGAYMVIKPSIGLSNYYIYAILLVAIHNAITNIVVSKYSSNATTYGYTFYYFLPLTIVAIIFFIADPIFPDLFDLLMIITSGIFIMLSVLFWTAAFHIAGKYSRIISPFLFTQLIWSSIFGYIYFGETLDEIAVIGIILIIISGSITFIYTKKI